MPKNDQILKASWKAIISENLRFWRPTWRQVGTKIDAEIDVIFERRLFEKSCSPCSESSNSQDSGDEVGSKNHSKIDQKMMPRRYGISASIFYQIFFIFRAKLASWAPPGGLLGASWRHLGRLGSVLGASWERLGGVLGRLGPSWVILERLGASWGILGPKNLPT